MSMSATNQYTAWLVNPGDGNVIAFAESSVVSYEREVAALTVPLSHDACQQLTFWHEQNREYLVPLFDLRGYQQVTQQAKLQAKKAPAGTLFLKFGSAVNRQIIGLQLPEPPCKVTVEEDEFEQFRADECGPWRFALLTGFFHKGAHLPLIDPASMTDGLFLRELEDGG